MRFQELCLKKRERLNLFDFYCHNILFFVIMWVLPLEMMDSSLINVWRDFKNYVKKKERLNFINSFDFTLFSSIQLSIRKKKGQLH